ncbi:MAG: DAK2 domain-containing protein [Chloroflexi bacterium]|nr:DAK2 domain-containing protein [Chloroflexota bacterium]
MPTSESISGQTLREMLVASTNWLEKSSADIDALNVFPVPDGDTGTNMLLTMRSTLEEAFRAPDHSASAVAQAMAKGALMGARGNSGVILSQIWRGMSKSLGGKEEITAADLAQSLREACDMAYRAMSNPVEGTILTVINEVAKAAEAEVAAGNSDITSVMETSVKAASEAVARTPRLLKVLREAGVVDAGGQGLYTILEGALRYLRGEMELMRFRKPQIIVSDMPAPARLPQTAVVEEVPYGYCTEFLLKGENLNLESIRKKLEKKGQSLIVVGDESAVRIHIHTLDPGNVVSFVTRLGTLHQVSMRNMDEQHQDFLEMQKEKGPTTDAAIITVVSGAGLADVFTSLGAAIVVPGGQTMNPSTKDLLQAVEAAPADKVIILPNNKNIIATAGQVQSLTKKTVEVIPTETIPQGVAALLAFDYEANLKTNTDIMKNAVSSVRSVEITRAVRSTRIGSLKIGRKQPIGFLNGDLVAVGDANVDVINQVLGRIDLKEVEVITIYYGADADPPEAEQISHLLREEYPNLQVEVIRGDQPNYQYIISVE